MAERADTVLLDVDGTLIDSTYHHALAWTRAFARFDQHPAVWRVHRAIGMGGDKLVPHLTSDAVEREHGDALREAWEEEYRALLPEVQAHEGARELVLALQDKGFKVALASSGKEEITDAAIEKLGLTRDDFAAITTSDDAEDSKPAPDILEVATSKAGGTRAVMVGDADWDVEAAKRSGAACVCVHDGGFSYGELTSAGAVLVVDGVGDLIDADWDAIASAEPGQPLKES